MAYLHLNFCTGHFQANKEENNMSGLFKTQPFTLCLFAIGNTYVQNIKEYHLVLCFAETPVVCVVVPSVVFQKDYTSLFFS